MFFYSWPIKKKASQRYLSEFAELDGGGGYFGFFFLRGCKSNRKFHRGKNRK